MMGCVVLGRDIIDECELDIAADERAHLAPPKLNPFMNTPHEQSIPCAPQINLFLRVERRREDGFHDLASLFQVVSWGDDMAFQPLGSSAGRDELVCSVADIPTDSRNLAIKVGDSGGGVGCWCAAGESR